MTRTSMRLLLAALLLTAGCTVLSLDVGPARATDWVTAGGSSERRSATAEALDPPLARVWSRNVEAAFGTGGAVIANETILVPTRRNEVVALRLADGGTLGTTRFAGPVEGVPLFADGLLVVGAADGRHTLSAFELRTGRTAWRHRVGPIVAAPLRVGARVVTAGLDGHVRAFNLRTGAEGWAVQPDSAAALHASPVLAGERLVVADDRGGVHALDPATGAVQWRVATGLAFYEAPAVAGGLVVLPTRRGVLLALDAATGAERWRFAAEPLVRFGSVAVGEALVFVGSTEGLVRALDRESGAVVWEARVPGGVTAAPLLAGGVLYVGTLRERLHALDARTGADRWSGPLPGRVRTAPVPAPGGVLVLSEPRHATFFRPEPLRPDASR